MISIAGAFFSSLRQRRIGRAMGAITTLLLRRFFQRLDTARALSCSSEMAPTVLFAQCTAALCGATHTKYALAETRSRAAKRDLNGRFL
jgi:hypothetical protein